MSKTDVRGRRSFLLGVTDPFVLATTSVARASAIGLKELVNLEILEFLEELEHLQKLE